MKNVLTKTEKRAAAEKILAFLRALNRPPKRIRTPSGFTNTHEILRRRARIELDIEFADLPSGGVMWSTHDEQLERVGRALIATCVECGDPFIKGGSRAKACSNACSAARHQAQARARRATNPEKVRRQERARRAANPDKARAKKRAWDKAHPEKTNARSRAWRAANPDRARANTRAWRAANREHDNQRHRAWCAANPERVRAKNRAWYAANPEKAKALRREATRRYALKKKLEGSKS